MSSLNPRLNERSPHPSKKNSSYYFKNKNNPWKSNF